MQIDLHNILSLFTATIIADKHIYASEINAFLKSKGTLKIARQIDPKISEAKLLAWYEMNKDDIRQKLMTPYFKDWLYATLENLTHVSDKDRILDVMREIAIADGEVHVSERALISLTQRYWDLN